MPVLWAKHERKEEMSICGELEICRTTILLYHNKLRKFLACKEMSKADKHIYYISRQLVDLYKRRSMLEDISIYESKPLSELEMSMCDELETSRTELKKGKS